MCPPTIAKDYIDIIDDIDMKNGAFQISIPHPPEYQKNTNTQYIAPTPPFD